MIHNQVNNFIYHALTIGTYSQATLSDESTAAASSDVVPSSPRAESNSTPSYNSESRLHLTCILTLTQDGILGLYVTSWVWLNEAGMAADMCQTYTPIDHKSIGT